MTKKQIIHNAMEIIENENDKYSCCAVAEACGCYHFYLCSLATKYRRFYGFRSDQVYAYEWGFSDNDEERKQERLTALALFAEVCK